MCSILLGASSPTSAGVAGRSLHGCGQIATVKPWGPRPDAPRGRVGEHLCTFVRTGGYAKRLVTAVVFHSFRGHRVCKARAQDRCDGDTGACCLLTG
jgi:hypothetical protein